MHTENNEDKYYWISFKNFATTILLVGFIGFGIGAICSIHYMTSNEVKLNEEISIKNKEIETLKRHNSEIFKVSVKANNKFNREKLRGR
jgi:hypothetical protein